jgi:hypothetical protein
MERTDLEQAVSPQPGSTGCIAVRNDYEWMGNPAAGRFAVYLDGRFAGWAPLGGELRQQVVPGTHFVRVRWNYFLSPRVLVTVGQDETKWYSADRPRTHLFRAFLRAMIDPFHFLALAEIQPRGEEDPLVTAQKSQSRRARAERSARIGLIAGLLLLVPLEALFTWGQGIANALTVGVILLVVVGGGQWVIYRVIVKRVSKW